MCFTNYQCAKPGELLSIMDYTRRLRAKGVPFSGLEVYKRVRISQAQEHTRKGLGKLSFQYF